MLSIVLMISLAVPTLADRVEESDHSLMLSEDTNVEEVKTELLRAVQKNSLTASSTVDPIDIILQPQDQSGKVGDMVTFSIVAFGSNLTYEWYMIHPNLPDTPTYLTDEASWTIPISESYDGIKIYCILKDDKGNEKRSDTATVTVLPGDDGIVIIRQPKNQTGKKGEKVLFNVEAKGEDLTYTWYMYHPKMPDYAEEISSEPYWAVEIDEDMDGFCFYCIVKDKKGNTRKSDVVTLTVDHTHVILGGYTTSLSDTIRINFYMDLGRDILSDDTAYMQFELPGSNHTDEKVMLKDAQKSTRGDIEYRVFSAGVAAKNMTGIITAQFIYNNGKNKSPKYEYTIKTYCDKIINNPSKFSAKSVALAKAMLNYGGYAQVYHGEKLNDLANKSIDTKLADFTLSSSYKPVKQGTATGVKWLGSTVMTTSSTGIRHYFKLDGDPSDYIFTADGKTLETGSSAKGTYVEISGIKAKELGIAKVLTVKNKKDNTKFVLKYSVYSYIKTVMENNSSNEKTRNLMKSMYHYCEAVKTYLGTG